MIVAFNVKLALLKYSGSQISELRSGKHTRTAKFGPLLLLLASAVVAL
jgi:hypothetical protein